jgi:hypothetical protein
MKLSVKTRNRRGGNPIWKENVGYGVIFLNDKNEKYISVDAFEGFGTSYKEREEPLIRIQGELNELIFVGTFAELETKLKQ